MKKVIIITAIISMIVGAVIGITAIRTADRQTALKSMTMVECPRCLIMVDHLDTEYHICEDCITYYKGAGVQNTLNQAQLNYYKTNYNEKGELIKK